MVRPREFDEEMVLNAAVQCFLLKGFEATSMRDLTGSMGITSASLYNAFGDKRSLYRKALKSYLEKGLYQRVIRLESNYEPRQAIEMFFKDIVERSINDRQQRGCLLVNSCVELSANDVEAKIIVDDFLDHLKGFFSRCVRAGQKDGTVSDLQNAEDISNFLVGVLLGVRVLARKRPKRSVLESVVRPAISVLDAGLREQENTNLICH